MQLNFRHHLITILFLICGCPAKVFSEVYRWTDANGKPHFSDQPVANQKAEKVIVETQTATKPDPELETYRQQARQQIRIADDERKAQLKVAEANKPAVSQKRCAEAKDSLRSSMAASMHYDLDEKGNRIYSSSAEIEAYREKIKRFIAQNCR